MTTEVGSFDSILALGSLFTNERIVAKEQMMKS
jgi:hypothetical protein